MGLVKSASKMLRKQRKLAVSLGDPLYRRALRHGVAPAIEHDALIRSLKIETCVDIGANKGQFALLVRAAFPAARILSFEPLADAACVFRRVFAGDAHTQLHPAAVGPADDTRTMNVSKAIDSSSLLPITAAQVAFAPGTQKVRDESVRVVRLATALNAADIAPPALLKLDVQGYELEALKGCEDLLGRFAHIYAELSFETFYAGQALAHEVIEWLAVRGFHLRAIDNPTLGDGGIIRQADFLFARAGAGHDTSTDGASS